MSKLLSLSVIFFIFSQSILADNIESAYCRAIFKKKGKPNEVRDFKFECDNYGENAKFQSRDGRYAVLGFSTEGCPVIIRVVDKKTGALTLLGSYDNNKTHERGGFAIFKEKLSFVKLSSVSTKDFNTDLGGEKTDVSAIVGCSTDKSVLSELSEN